MCITTVYFVYFECQHNIMACLQLREFDVSYCAVYIGILKQLCR